MRKRRSPQRHGWRARCGRSINEMLIYIVSMLGVALATLFVEWTALGEWEWSLRSPLVIVVFLGALGLLAVLLGHRKYLAQYRGTLLELRFHSARFRRFHKATVREVARGFLDHREISYALPEPHRGVADWRREFTLLRDRLQDFFLLDNSTTGLTLAPDVPAPLGVGIGFWITMPSDLRLLDLGREDDSSTWHEWGVEEQPGFGEVSVSEEPGEGQGIHIDAGFTGPSSDLGVPVRSTVRLAVKSGTENGPLVGTNKEHARIHPARVAAATVDAIREALHRCGEDGDPFVYVSLRATKTVPFAIGHLLSPANWGGRNVRDVPICGRSGCTQETCHQPWRHLVLVNWGQNGWETVWLVAEQGDPRSLQDLGALHNGEKEVDSAL